MSEGKELAPIQSMKRVLSMESVQDQFKNALQDNAPLFVASLIDVYGSDSQLMQCAPALVIKEALKAATLKLPINKNLGFAYIIAYKQSTKGPDGKWTKVSTPQMQIGYKGLIQLAIRTGQYRFINADMVYEGERVETSRVSGEISILGAPNSETVIGYFSYLETVNGFKKAIYWTKEKVLSHAQKFSKNFASDNSTWKTNFDSMALKTMLRNLLSKYGIMSVEMTRAIAEDDYEREEARVEEEVQQNANSEVVDAEWEEPAMPDGPPMVAPDQQAAGGNGGNNVQREF
jgi:recombination protein RecT